MPSPGRVPAILVVDDEPTIREVIRRYLEREGWRVLEAGDGSAALRLASQEAPALVILDLMLPGLDGLALARRLREAGELPILMLTAKSQAGDRIQGLEAGADDYVVKPFNPQELVLRVRAILRRTEERGRPRGPALEAAGIHMDPDSREVTVDGRPVTLTLREFDLLWTFLRHPRQVFSRSQLLDQVWGYEFHGDASTVTVHIRRLREKIELEPSHPRRLITLWGVGYKLEA
jgi:DNA-binding response OmpR family regulator